MRAARSSRKQTTSSRKGPADGLGKGVAGIDTFPQFPQAGIAGTGAGVGGGLDRYRMCKIFKKLALQESGVRATFFSRNRRP
jgi:hypothetical protein